MEALNASTLSASLTVNDVQASLAWYRNVLGFSVEREFVRDGALRFVSIRAGNVRFLLGQDDGTKGVDRVKGVGFSLQLTTGQDIDAIASRVKETGGTLASEPEDAWGARVFRVRDPDGFLLVISSER
jgi:uncharacterized glyoxalase superfamily protein PhnB